MTHPDNHFYGHSVALATYCGVVPTRPIQAQVQHGWSVSTGLPDRIRLPSRLRRLVWSKQNLLQCRRARISNVDAVGAPFIYLEGDSGPRQAVAGSTIVYPFHGWERADALGSHDDFIREIRERERGDVTVALYWTEFDCDQIRGRYEAAGFRVITHGQRSDPTFLLRQRNELLRHKRVVSNNVSTALWYGGHLGLEMQRYGPAFSIHSIETARLWQAYQRSRWPELELGIGGPAGRELAGRELGTDNRLSAEELMHLVGWDQENTVWSDRATRSLMRAEFHARRAAAVVGARLRLTRSAEDQWRELMLAARPD